MAIAIAMVGCGQPHDVGDTDADVNARDAGGVDAPNDAEATVRVDGGIDARTDARRETVYLVNESSCWYSDYGSPCRVACELDPDVPIQLTVTWSGPYCCTLPVGSPTETFWDCRCLEGEVRCPFSVDLYRIPTSTCEFCPGTGSGSLYADTGTYADAFTADAFTSEPSDAGP